jgi:hypothetical protein
MNGVRTLVLASVLAATPALAVLSSTSSCPAPCLKPPKSALFVKETGVLDANSKISTVTGTLSRGTAHTVVRLDATIFVLGQGKIGNLLMSPRLNGSYMDPVYSGPVSPCPIGQSFCVVTGTVWFDIDQLEAKNPGEFVGQPLNIELYGGAISGSDPTANYVATFSAEVVKKK